ncbi:copper chaperone PCu(A)C [Paraburkholderia phosphatilytica]|uniref:copper chaperone PCu(A)C n=1 Tax=Paraburkholderia phosphatilytica TaxID=2282883 RepID=UPI000E5174BD|nr:copper chaperone PCu(A)C [Paraburkholderia phosphatilytica]
MNRIRRIPSILIAGALAAGLATLSAPGFAAPAAVSVSDCWIRLLPGNLPSGGYFKANNSGAEALDLVGVDSEAFGMAMLHQTQSQGSTSTMAMVDKAPLPAHGTLTFAPGGYHVMLEQPKTKLKVGTTTPLTFSFSDGEKVTASCAVKSAGSTGQ